MLLYFSASWCGPCQAFTPSLVEFHRQHAEASNLDVLLVSQDISAEAMLAYMGDHEMLFPAVPYDRIARSRLRVSYGGLGNPSLVVLSPSGEVVVSSVVDGTSPADVLDEMRRLGQ